MRTFFEDDSIKLLMGKVLTEFGKATITPADCKSLSEAVLASTKKTISETTLKRLFGFARRSFEFSIYTLDTLSEYVGYSNWENFSKENAKEFSKAGGDDVNKWQALRKTCAKYSGYTLQTIKNSSGIPFPETIHREELTQFIRKFLQTNQSIAPIIAPTGFGKSVGMAHTVLKLWHGAEAVYPQDICCFINVHQVQTIALYKHSLTEWLGKYLHLLYDEIASLVASREADARLVIIIEGFDEKTFSADKLKLVYNNIIEFINYNSQYHWIKIILTMRPSSWAKLAHTYLNPVFFHNRVFIDNSYPNENTIHHTLPFTPAEIKKIIALGRFGNTMPVSFSSDLLELLSYPRFLEILFSIIAPDATSNQTEEALMYRIIHTDVSYHSQFDTHSAVKTRILDKILGPVVEGAPPDANNEWFFVKDTLTTTAYNQLIDDYMLVEEKASWGSSPYPKHIRFSNKYIEYYFASLLLLKKNDNIINTTLVDHIRSSTSLQPISRYIIKWYLLRTLYANNTRAIQEIFHSGHLSPAGKLHYFDFLVNLSDNSNQKKIIETLLLGSDFIAHFFEQGLLYRHIGAKNNKLLTTLFELAPETRWKYCSLVLLYLNAMLHLQTYHAEAYLREYRKISKADDGLQMQFARDIMAILLDYARYDICSEQLPEILKRFTDDVLENRASSDCVIHLNMILAIYGLLYMESFKELHRFAIALQVGLTPEQKEAYGFIKTLSDYAGKYAELMHKGLESIHARKGTEELLLKEQQIPEADILNKTLFYLLSARYYEKKKDLNKCIALAKAANTLAAAHQLHLLSLLSFRILKHAYTLADQADMAAEAEGDMKQLLQEGRDGAGNRW
ncbi:NACHT domain-containing protein [Filimonas effusa]|uniref:Uncharacterized protein n=1 Tax=Filimonas effusa TaxID=2508721 RepID=A0A4Q1D222_9BACT|nr:hypothetical protein [Filimonas effusa]RXK81350.1 hypothetical protein ESB13_20660 [Filimonas effusa]